MTPVFPEPEPRVVYRPDGPLTPAKLCSDLAESIDDFLDLCRINGEDHGDEGIVFSAFLPSIEDQWEMVLVVSAMVQFVMPRDPQPSTLLQHPDGSLQSHLQPGPLRDFLDFLTSLRSSKPLRWEPQTRVYRLHSETLTKLQNIRDLLIQVREPTDLPDDWITIKIAAEQFQVSESHLYKLTNPKQKLTDPTQQLDRRKTGTKVFVRRSELERRFPPKPRRK